MWGDAELCWAPKSDSAFVGGELGSLCAGAYWAWATEQRLEVATTPVIQISLKVRDNLARSFRRLTVLILISVVNNLRVSRLAFNLLCTFIFVFNFEGVFACFIAIEVNVIEWCAVAGVIKMLLRGR